MALASLHGQRHEPSTPLTWHWHSLRQERALVLLLLMVVALVVMGQLNHQLWTPDEPREAAIVMEMFHSGDWVVPTLGGVSFIEKPPLYYITATLVLKVLGTQVDATSALRIVGMLWAFGILGCTGLLAQRLFANTRATLWSLIALGSMEGFLLNTHWIRVDSTLAFFVIFTLWAYAEYYLAGRSAMLRVAGLGLAGAFLSKGPIGPLTIFFGWAPLFALSIRSRLRQQGAARVIGHHLLMVVCLILPVAIWLFALLHHQNGDALWQAWFWDNQVGRLTGTSKELGHIKANSPFYYIAGVAEYALPWTPLLFAWLWRLKQQKWTTTHWFLLVWAIGTVVLLSMSATKRTLYLLPLMPVFALMIGQLSLDWPRWTRYLGRFWCGVLLVPGSLLMAAPWVLPHASHLTAKLPAAVLDALLQTGSHYVLAGALFLVGLWMVWQCRHLSGEVLTAGAAGILFLMSFVQLFPVIDQSKGMETGIRNFLTQVPEAGRDHIAAWRLEETELGLLSVYGQWTLANLEDGRVVQILRCQDKQYSSVLVGNPPDQTPLAGQPALHYEVVARSDHRSGKGNYGLFWLRGQCAGNAQ